MSEEFDGPSIARARIAEEAERRTGQLDLGDLGLPELPPELFALRHLRELNLGSRFVLEEGQWKGRGGAHGSPNWLDWELDELGLLPHLEWLSVGRTDLESLDALSVLRNLRTLDISFTEASDLSPLAGLVGLRRLKCSSTKACDLSPLAGLVALQSLDCQSMKVSDLSPIAGLGALQSLDCSGTQVSDLSPIAGLVALQSLNCSSTQVSDLSPIAALGELQTLNVFRTKLSDLSPLTALIELRSLDCSYTQVSDLSPLAGLGELQRLVCTGTQVSDLSPLAGLGELEALRCSYTQVSDLSPLAALGKLDVFWFSGTQVSDLSPLAGLGELQTVVGNGTKISDLSPLAGLGALQCLLFDETQVSDLSPLAGLGGLQAINCSKTQVSDLSPLANLGDLQLLSCGFTEVSDLSPLAELTALSDLSCPYTQVSDLSPLAGLGSLEKLHCSGTPVSDLSPLAGLTALQSLSCSQTPVSDLSPLAGLTALQWLDCSRTAVSDLSPLAALPALQELDCSECRLGGLPPALWRKDSLIRFRTFNCRIPGIPPEVLSQTGSENCLDALWAHFADLAEGASPLPDVKVMVLGNGRTGKTQICRRLAGAGFEERWDSTHGVRITSAVLAERPGEETARLHLWDFGGQDIYHGTHALFLRGRAAFLIVWARDVENADAYEHQGIRFRNHPLRYWAEYVRHQGDADSPVLIVQNKCDGPTDDAKRSPVPEETLEALGRVSELRYSAATDRRRAALDEALHEAADQVLRPDGQEPPQIGAGRLRVKRRLEAMRDDDAQRPPDERRHRILDQDEFRRLCDEAGGISSPALLLVYLNNAGTVFHREGLFGDRIVLDQAWALDAIYAVFERERCYRQLKRLHGRFTRPLLEALVWDGRSADEQKLLLSMMESCGICFVHRGGTGHDDEPEYIAPDLLPERAAVEVELDEKWGGGEASASAAFEYPFLHAGLMREVIARIGGEAGVNALYWAGGVCLYETGTRSRALIEEEAGEGFGGRIRLETKGGQSALLLDRLAQRIEEAQARMGLSPSGVERTAAAGPQRAEPAPPGGPDRLEAGQPKLSFGQPAAPEPQWFISYAWSDDTPEGRKREAVVERICAEGEKRGIRVQRDQTLLGAGARVSAFMQRIGQGDRVFVVLSDKYLQSPYCMFELFELWRTSRAEGEAFLRRVRIYALPDTKIRTPQDRIRHARFWRRQHDELRAEIKRAPEDVSTKDFDRFKGMGRFHQNIGQILETMADVVQPRSLEDLERYGFDDPPDGSPATG